MTRSAPIPASVQNEARRGLAYISQGNAGGTLVGQGIGSRLAAGGQLAEGFLQRIVAFFTRMDNGQNLPGADPGDPGYQNLLTVSASLYGGQPGFTWASTQLAQWEKEGIKTLLSDDDTEALLVLKQTLLQVKDVSDGEDHTDSAMVALYPPAAVAADLAWAGGLDSSDLHVTLVFLGDAASVNTDAVEQAVTAVAQATDPLTLSIGGMGRFNGPVAEGDPVWAGVTGAGLGDFQRALAAALAPLIPAQHDPWIPHMTLGYVPVDEDPPVSSIPTIPWPVGSVVIAIGDEHTVVPLGAPASPSSLTDALTAMLSPVLDDSALADLPDPDDGSDETDGSDENLTAAIDASLAQIEAGIKFAGLVVLAADTGRVLLLQRALDDDDPASGRWEYPGGALEGDETPYEGAVREWAEEVGHPVPDGEVTGSWIGTNGVWQGFVLLTPTEADVDPNTGVDDRITINPDQDPDDDHAEVAAWWEPSDLPGMAALRDECQDTPWELLAVPYDDENKGDLDGLETKVDWTESLHPRDSHGRFATVGAIVDAVDGDGKKIHGQIIATGRGGKVSVRDDAGHVSEVAAKDSTVVSRGTVEALHTHSTEAHISSDEKAVVTHAGRMIGHASKKGPEAAAASRTQAAAMLRSHADNEHSAGRMDEASHYSLHQLAHEVSGDAYSPEDTARRASLNPDQQAQFDAATKDANTHARAVLERVHTSEPEVTKALTGIAASHGGEMTGLGQRVKSVGSLTLKLRDGSKRKETTPEEYAPKIGDALRYTSVVPDEHFASSINGTVSALESQGFHLAEPLESTFGPPPRTYQGLHANFINDAGLRFELQFHTPESIRVKNAIHGHYETERNPDAPLEARQAEWDVMAALQGQVPTPPALDTIPDVTHLPGTQRPS